MVLGISKDIIIPIIIDKRISVLVKKETYQKGKLPAKQ